MTKKKSIQHSLKNVSVFEDEIAVVCLKWICFFLFMAHSKKAKHKKKTKKSHEIDFPFTSTSSIIWTFSRYICQRILNPQFWIESKILLYSFSTVYIKLNLQFVVMQILLFFVFILSGSWYHIAEMPRKKKVNHECNEYDNKTFCYYYSCGNAIDGAGSRHK